MSRLSPVHCALLCMVAWSFLPVASRAGQSQLDSFQFLFWTNVLSALAVGCTLKWRSVLRTLPIPGSLWLSSAGLGFLGCFFYYLCLYYGYSKTSATEVLIIQYLWPAMTAGLAILILKEPLNRYKGFGVLFGLIAALTVITRGEFNKIQAEAPDILAIVFIGALSFSLFSVLSKKEKQLFPSFNVFLYFFWAAIFSAIAQHIWSDFSWPSSTELIPLGLNGTLINGISYILWIHALNKTEASKIAPLVYLAPVLSVIWITVFFQEPFHSSYAIAIGLAIVSGLLVSKSPVSQSETSEDSHLHTETVKG